LKSPSGNGPETRNAWSSDTLYKISGDRIIIHIADEVFSPKKTGLRDGQLIEVDLEDITTCYTGWAALFRKICF
jgi:hypothetical protein